MTYVRHYKRTRGPQPGGFDYGFGYRKVRSFVPDEQPPVENKEVDEEVDEPQQPEAPEQEQNEAADEAPDADDADDDEEESRSDSEDTDGEADGPGEDTESDGNDDKRDESPDSDQIIFELGPEADGEPERADFNPEYNIPGWIEPTVDELGTKHLHFKSTREYSQWLRGLVATGELQRTDRLVWNDWRRTLKGVELLEEGTLEHLNEAEELLEKFQEQLEVPTDSWHHAEDGRFPDVESYLNDDPESMWDKFEDNSDRTPLRVWVGLTSTWSVEESDLVKRGVALAAFALAMGSKRPVYITPFVNGHTWGYGDNTQHSIVSWDIQTSPMVLSQLMTVTKPEVTRYLGCAVVKQLHSSIPDSIPFAYTERKHIAMIRDEDLYLSHIQHSDPMLRDPITWIKQKLEQYGQEPED